MTEELKEGVPDEDSSLGRILGEMVWLASQSPAHRHALLLSDLEWFLMPPLRFGQCRVFRDQGQPVAAALWAYLDDDARERLTEGAVRLKVHEWQGGPHCWLVDLIAPFGGQEAVLADLERDPLGATGFEYPRLHPDGRREIVAIPPRQERE